ncbi:hypothetical protein GGI15_004854 [Coemansia interrupta]|uniref:Myb-like domain-containing protein n=1 Tax=Coemansia interrupta TaxID=1126814 RepID=A0A9W8H147_9FUNG|nr:hypothetical protein GGI15_004854 [Coemansia interrupta]
MNPAEQQQHFQRFFANRSFELLPIQRELISGAQSQGTSKASGGSSSNAGDGAGSAVSHTPLITSFWPMVGSPAAMNGGLIANLQPTLPQTTGLISPWPLAVPEAYPSALLFTYSQQNAVLAATSAAADCGIAGGSSTAIPGLSPMVPIPSMTCSERPHSRTDTSLMPMFSPFNPPLSLSPQMLTSEVSECFTAPISPPTIDSVLVQPPAAIAPRPFAEQPAGSIKAGASGKLVADEREHQTYINIDQFFELQRLIRLHGEDWNKLGQLMNMRGSDLSACWNGYTVDSVVTREWTKGEMDILGLCRELGIPCRLSSKIIGSKLPLQCRRKILKKDKVDMHAMYEHLYPRQTHDQQNQHQQSAEALSWTTGHVNVLHKTRTPASTPENDLVTKVVEKMQPQTVGVVDWAAVSQKTGVALKQCLEGNRFDEGKRSWMYTAENFDWGMAERMRSFIMATYPAPLPIDFVAVSNFLWTDKTDCISMYGLLCGRYEWTPAVLSTISELVTLGWTDDQIARHLSPTMTGSRIAHTRLMFHAQAQAYASVYGSPQIPAEMDAPGLARIQQLVDHYAGDRSIDIVKLLELIRASLPAHDRTLVDRCALITISGHTTCANKMIRRAHRKPKVKSKAEKGAAKHASAAVGAGPLGFSDPAFYSAKWTDKEIDMLIQYARANGPERNWRHFADIIGTKTPAQCSNKYRSLRRYHKINM